LVVEAPAPDNDDPAEVAVGLPEALRSVGETASLWRAVFEEAANRTDVVREAGPVDAAAGVIRTAGDSKPLENPAEATEEDRAEETEEAPVKAAGTTCQEEPEEVLKEESAASLEAESEADFDWERDDEQAGEATKTRIIADAVRRGGRERGKRPGAARKERAAFADAGEMIAGPARLVASKLANSSRNSRMKPPADFEELLRVWEIKDKGSYRRVMKEQRTRNLIFVLTGIIGCLALYLAGAGRLSLLPLGPAVCGLLTGCWRLSVLSGKSFCGFAHWLLGRHRHCLVDGPDGPVDKVFFFDDMTADHEPFGADGAGFPQGGPEAVPEAVPREICEVAASRIVPLEATEFADLDLDDEMFPLRDISGKGRPDLK
ncbi:MAG: hypothetical protein LBP95_07695, partial [Deltaproteobacteria bacterium]|jgi:hypothetical protein|nr:hypothetical protein [Deltaproteobacteria bacterium]